MSQKLTKFSAKVGIVAGIREFVGILYILKSFVYLLGTFLEKKVLGATRVRAGASRK